MSWSDVSANLPGSMGPWQTVQGVAVDPTEPDTIWVGVKYWGVFVSRDDGRSWQWQRDGLDWGAGGVFGPQCLRLVPGPSGRNAVVCGNLLYSWELDGAHNQPVDG